MLTLLCMADGMVMLCSNCQLHLRLSVIVLTTCTGPSTVQACCFLQMHAIAAVPRGFALKSESLAKAAMPQWLAITKTHGLPFVLPEKSGANCFKSLDFVVSVQV